MEIIMYIFVSIAIIALQAITPFIIRKSECFGVNVGERANRKAELKQLKKQYVGQVILWTSLVAIIGIALLQGFNTSESIQAGIFIASMFGQLIVSFIIYYRFHLTTLQWKKEKIVSGEISTNSIILVDTSFHRKKMVISYTWFIVPFLIFIITLAITVVFYQQAPMTFPTHFNMNGTVTNTVVKSPRIALLFPMLQLAMIGLFIFINFVIARSKQQVENEKPSDSLKRNMLFRQIFSKAMLIMCTILVIDFLVTQVVILLALPIEIMTVTMLGSVVIIIFGLVLLSVKVGQGGSRLKFSDEPDGANKPIRDDDAFWKAGIFYFNRNDPALFVEKRFGIGWTINAARPVAWLSFLVIILLIVLITLLF
ncbi:DUF1648 domain-containing protein [Listeria seeligeri]|uniref:DUF1648 domain-containing protein n=1 Tax=Listeria seeligeri TaxID=1640 RepID=UPI0016296977|nr:DUF1648 domain-containing protein [Listeria seeligeri]MBC1727802.1 DUF1648 domain-containing protein [Listeria seeligeri]MBC1848160.1 DUF1648 domain-containing protein [Listeria seeligeri]MBC1854278.1 DUF1648 domain-containing protein [Listeria seeligeri]MBC1870374.1 DUF1648 domain-containing protein [Listeria seeligeri]MBC2222396.1 DUF1648 domain-containing protein [Listeria seeligeri]